MHVWFFFIFILLSFNFPSTSDCKNLEEEISWNVFEYKLANGLKILLLPDNRAPMIISKIWYGVGSRDESPGKTGIAHFLEHMMFKGTKKYGLKVFSNLIKKSGGSHNAFTSFDYTGYYEKLPSSKLELAIKLEADRMKNLKLDPTEFELERKVVLEERRSRVDDNPVNYLFEKLRQKSFTSHTYANPIIGWEEDLKKISLKNMESFYKRFYVPENATFVVVGDLKISETIKIIKKHFGKIKSDGSFKRKVLTEPPQKEERSILVKRNASLPYFAMAYHTPNWKHPDAAALALLEYILSGGESSRIYQRLVRKESIALSAGAEYRYLSYDTDLFYFYAQPSGGIPVSKIKKVFYEELKKITTFKVSHSELERAIKGIEASSVFSMDSHYYRAMMLGRSAVCGNWKIIKNYLKKIRKVSPEEILRVAKKYFHAKNRTIAELIPQKAK
ncbi:MAG: pitrilysin family protein [Nitrospinota bacterium]|nr:pitrilysin family protein [Nitrospinota bacterium]